MELTTVDLIFMNVPLKQIIEKGVYRKDLQRVLKSQKKMKDYFKSWFSKESFDPVMLPDLPPFIETSELVVLGGSEEWVLKSDFEDEELIVEISAKVKMLCDYLQSKMPRIPPTHKVSDFIGNGFLRIFSVVNSPTEVIHSLDQGILSRSMTSTLSETFPEIYEYFKFLFFDELTESTIKNKDYKLPWKKLKQSYVLLGEYPVDSTLQTLLQVKPAAPEQKSPSGSVNISSSNLSSSDRLEKRRT